MASKTSTTSTMKLFVTTITQGVPHYISLSFYTLETKFVRIFLNVPCIALQFLFHLLTHYSPMLLLYTPLKHQKTLGFSDVFRSIEKQRWAVMG